MDRENVIRQNEEQTMSSGSSAKIVMARNSIPRLYLRQFYFLGLDLAILLPT